MGRLPSVAKGRLRECFRCGFWYPERDSRIRKINDRWLCIWDIDTLTDEQRRTSIKGN